MKNYYEILEVNKNASLDIIKKIYKYKIKKNHPDLFSGKEKIEAEKVTKELIEAYNVISDLKKREEYDNMLYQNNDDIASLKKQNQILKSKVEYLENIVENFLDEDQVNQIYSTINNQLNNNWQINKEINDINQTKDDISIFKTILNSFFITFKDIFLKPLALIIILFFILIILKMSLN